MVQQKKRSPLFTLASGKETVTWAVLLWHILLQASWRDYANRLELESVVRTCPRWLMSNVRSLYRFDCRLAGCLKVFCPEQHPELAQEYEAMAKVNEDSENQQPFPVITIPILEPYQIRARKYGCNGIF
jgi:hypothetical protein